MPIQQGGNDFWSGYFSSRPGLKGFVRKSNGFLQVYKLVKINLRLKETFLVYSHCLGHYDVFVKPSVEAVTLILMYIVPKY